MPVDERIRKFAESPFLRPGGVDFDCGYANSVWDARERVELERLIAENPDVPVVTGSGRMGSVPHHWKPPSK